MTFSGGLIDSQCPSSSPVRCSTGDCVAAYHDCFSAAIKASTVWHSPIAWGADYDAELEDPCQVYCQDGSCRDRQENCPLILGCTDPLLPIKCMSGFCAQSTSECSSLYGAELESEQAGQPSAYCQTEEATTEVDE